MNAIPHTTPTTSTQVIPVCLAGDRGEELTTLASTPSGRVGRSASTWMSLTTESLLGVYSPFENSHWFMTLRMAAPVSTSQNSLKNRIRGVMGDRTLTS